MVTAPTEVKKAADGEFSRPRLVCFVCTGNTCRSPMAEAVANALSLEALNAYPAAVRDALAPPIQAVSAGLYAENGAPISRHALEALESAEIPTVKERDYHNHTAHTVTEEDADRADLLVAMTPAHAMELMMRFPAAAKKITLMPMAISDPFGGDLAVYQACLREITEGVRRLLFEEGAT
ncbi:MAG: hypothetical protein IKJ35_06445 [Clostridia bacterium]|nr:hypothetical protein [Clostridia bacterium]